MRNRAGSLPVKAKLLLAGAITFLLILGAIVASVVGYRAMDRAGTVALRFANSATTLQTLIKDVNQLVLTEGAVAVRTRIGETVKVLDGQFQALGDLDGERKPNLKSWNEARKRMEELLARKSVSAEDDEALVLVVRLIALLEGLAGEVNNLAEVARTAGTQTAGQVATVAGLLFSAILGFVALVFYLLYRSLRKQLGEEPATVTGVVQEVALGKLNVRPPARRSPAPVGSLLGAMDEMTDRLTMVVRSIDETNLHVSQAAFQITSMAAEIGRDTTAQQACSTEVAQATEELGGISHSVNQLAQAARERIIATENQASEGLKTLNENLHEINRTVDEVTRTETELRALSGSAERIHDIIDSISAIAAQTNLLSLNASIEAARAGEMGRGFAVVADEVRKLAQRTGEATTMITTIVTELVGQIETTRKTMDEVVQSAHTVNRKSEATQRTIERMVELVRENDQANSEIVGASGEQLGKLAVLDQTLKGLFGTLEASSEKVGITLEVSHNLYRTVESLGEKVKFFDYDRNTTFTARQHEKRHYPRIAAELLGELRAQSGCHKVMLEDLSLGGSKLKSLSPLVIGDGESVELRLLKPEPTLDQYTHQQPVNIPGTVSWVHEANGEYHCGVAFANQSAAANSALRECFAYFHAQPTFQQA